MKNIIKAVENNRKNKKPLIIENVNKITIQKLQKYQVSLILITKIIE